MKKLYTSSLLLFSLLLGSSLFGNFDDSIRGKILYNLHRGEIHKGLTHYLKHSKECQAHDWELLQEAGKLILERGMNSGDSEIQLLSLFGAQVAQNSSLLPLFEMGLENRNGDIQLAAVSCLGKLEDDRADRLLNSALSSPYLIVRLEAAHLLSKREDPQIVNYLKSLQGKVPPEVLPLFSHILVSMDHPAATQMLRQFLSDENPPLRKETLLAIAENKRDDLLHTIRSLALHPDIVQREACIYALGRLKDQRSLPLFRKLAKHKDFSLKLLSLNALAKLGDAEALHEIFRYAKQSNPYALFLLSRLGKKDPEQAHEILKKCVQSSDPSIRCNAAYALLQLGLPECVAIKEFLVPDGRDLALCKQYSPGGALMALKVITSAHQRSKSHPLLLAESQLIKEKILLETVELPSSLFLEIVTTVLTPRSSTLIPCAIKLLTNQQDSNTIALLEKHQEHAGAPWIRHWCTLALCHLKESRDDQRELLCRWVKEMSHSVEITLRHNTPSTLHPSTYELTPEERSSLFMTSLELLASMRNEEGVTTLIEAIAEGLPKNRYPLAGLLLRTIE